MRYPSTLLQGVDGKQYTIRPVTVHTVVVKVNTRRMNTAAKCRNKLGENSLFHHSFHEFRDLRHHETRIMVYPVITIEIRK